MANALKQKPKSAAKGNCMRRIVVPGEVVTEERKRPGAHVFLSEGKICSDSLGIVDDGKDYISIVPLEGKYIPQLGDLIVGVVVAENFGNYFVDISSVHDAAIPKNSIRETLRLESVVSAKIMRVNEMSVAELGNIRTFFGGQLISVSAVKVPRIIGKNGSMLEVLKRGTNCSLMVGRNGRIWAKGGNTQLLISALEKIQRESHTENLTAAVEEFLKGAAASAKADVSGEPQPMVRTMPVGTGELDIE